MGGLMEGFLSQVAPNYFNAMKQQEQDYAKSVKNKETAKLYADHIKNINAPLRAATSDPRRISIYDSMETMAAMQGEDIAKMFPEYFGNVIKNNLEDSNRSVVQKNADYVYSEAIPEQNREMVRQIEMQERPADIQDRSIKQQNADTLRLNSGTSQKNADINMRYKDAQILKDGTIAQKPIKLGMPPAKHVGDYNANNATVEEIDKAIKMIEENPDALGIQNYANITEPTQDIKNRFTKPEHTATIAQIGKIKSLRKHDITGATATFGEMPDLRTHLPSSTDDKDSAIAKLKVLRDEVLTTQKQYDNYYNENNGFKSISPPKDQKEEQGFQYSDTGKERYDHVNKTLESKVGNKWVKIYDNVTLNPDGSINSTDSVDKEIQPEQIDDKNLGIDDLVNKYKSK